MGDCTDSELCNPWTLSVPKEGREAFSPLIMMIRLLATLDLPKQQFGSPRIFNSQKCSEILQHVCARDSCQRYKSFPNNRYLGLTKTTRQWETWYPSAKSTKCSSYLVAIQSSFTKWIHCRPIRKATSQATTRTWYEDIVLRFGCPKLVFSDNGTQLTGRHSIRELHLTIYTASQHCRESQWLHSFAIKTSGNGMNESSRWTSLSTPLNNHRLVFLQHSWIKGVS